MTNICEGNGWKIAQLDTQTKSWYSDDGESISKEELKGAIGITFKEEKRTFFHKMTSLITRMTHWLRDLGSDHAKECTNCRALDTNKTTHAFIITDTMPETDPNAKQVIRVADSDDPGIVEHAYDLRKALAKDTGYYTKIAIVIPPKQLRDRISLISKACSSTLEVGNVITEVYELKTQRDQTASKIEKLMKEQDLLEKKQDKLEKQPPAKVKASREQISTTQGKLGRVNGKIKKLSQKLLEITTKLETKLPERNELLKTHRAAKYNDNGLRAVGFAGKLPFFNIRPFFHSLNIFTKWSIQNTTYSDYVNVLEGKVITRKDGTPQDMICSEFASKMIKMAKLDLAVEEKIGAKELSEVKGYLKKYNTIIDNEQATPELKDIAQKLKDKLLLDTAAKIKDVINEKMKTDKLFTMKDNGIVPAEVLELGQRALAGK